MSGMDCMGRVKPAIPRGDVGDLGGDLGGDGAVVPLVAETSCCCSEDDVLAVYVLFTFFSLGFLRGLGRTLRSSVFE